jgi:hypothetical protein
MRYRVHRIKDAPKEHFRWTPHTGGLAVVKLKDYGPAEEIEAPSPYALWKLLSDSAPLRPGDVLETLDDQGAALRLEIYKYIGFEPAAWFVHEPKPEPAVHADKNDGA